MSDETKGKPAPEIVISGKSIPAPKGRGRPSVFSQDVAVEICANLALGKSLRSICSEEGMPSEATVRQWAIDNVQGFYSHYTRARDLGLDAMADELLSIADDGSNDYAARQRNGSAERAPDPEVVNRSRLRVDARKWYLSKLAPKKYGDKQSLELSGADGAPLAPILNVSVSRPAVAENTQPRIVDVSPASDKS